MDERSLSVERSRSAETSPSVETDPAREATAVLDRLARIEALDRDGAPAALLLEELRALVAEAERWTTAEGGDAAKRATTRLRSALAAERSEAGMIAV